MKVLAVEQQLTAARAREAVSHAMKCARHAGVKRFELAASRPIEGFAHELDTLVVVVKPQPSHVWHLLQPEQQPPSTAAAGATLLREALLLLHAVSCCRGFSFHESPTFWVEMLSLKLWPAMSIATQRFPCIVLDWNPRDVAKLPAYKRASRRLLETSLLALFTVSSEPPPPLSPNGQALLASIVSVSHSRMSSLIECVVVLRFAQVADVTKAHVGAVVSAANASAGSALSPFRWVGVRLIESEDARYVHPGLVSVANLAIMTHLCASLPPALPVEIRWPTSRVAPRAFPTDSQRRALVTFLSPAIGVSATEGLGCMAVLDLTYRDSNSTMRAPALDFAALGTLLPFAHSLQKLCVAVASTSDLVWLLYAVVHPLTRSTKWRALDLDGQHFAPATWAVASRLVQPSSLFASLWSLLTRPPDATIASEDVDTRSVSEQCVRRTARIASDAVVLSPDKSTTLAELTVGREVELCDTTTAISELQIEQGHADLDDVAVVVAGVGIGWVHKRHLSDIADTVYDGRPRSSLSTLALGDHVACARDLPSILRIFGPALKHLRSRHSGPLAMSDVARRCPQLESLELPRLYSSYHDVDAVTMDLPKLRDVGVAADAPTLDTCFRMFHSLPTLRTARLVYRVSNTPADWELVDQHVATLIAAKKRTLRLFALITLDRRPATTPPRLDHRMSCSADAKVALLSVLWSACDTGMRSPLASLSTDVVRLVFDFAGPSVMTFDVPSSATLWPRDWYSPSYERGRTRQ